MTLSVTRGKIDGARLEVDEYYVETWDDQETLFFGLSFTWHLRKDVRDELRALRDRLNMVSLN
jgi:hypothetical protein